MAKSFPLKVRAPKWQLAYFWPNNWIFGHKLMHMDMVFVLNIIYVKIDGQTNFRTIGLSFLFHALKLLKWRMKRVHPKDIVHSMQQLFQGVTAVNSGEKQNRIFDLDPEFWPIFAKKCLFLAKVGLNQKSEFVFSPEFTYVTPKK